MKVSNHARLVFLFAAAVLARRAKNIRPNRRDPGLRRLNRRARKIQSHLAQQFHSRRPEDTGFPGAIIADKSFNGVTEWAYGATDWFEAGLVSAALQHLEKSRRRRSTAASYACSSLRRMPRIAPSFTARISNSVTTPRIGSRVASPPRFGPSSAGTCIPWTSSSTRFSITTFRGGFKNLDFAPAARIAYNFTPKFALAVESYSDVGPLRAVFVRPGRNRTRFGASSIASTKIGSFEAGMGFGVTPASDKVTLKLIFSRDLN